MMFHVKRFLGSRNWAKLEELQIEKNQAVSLHEAGKKNMEKSASQKQWLDVPCPLGIGKQRKSRERTISIAGLFVIDQAVTFSDRRKVTNCQEAERMERLEVGDFRWQ